PAATPRTGRTASSRRRSPTRRRLRRRRTEARSPSRRRELLGELARRLVDHLAVVDGGAEPGRRRVGVRREQPLGLLVELLRRREDRVRPLDLVRVDAPLAVEAEQPRAPRGLSVALGVAE